MHALIRFLPITVAVLTPFSANAKEKIRIACVGDSITFGSGIGDREHASYPAQLQDILGDDYEVKNFGISARTMLSTGDHPWVKEPQCQQSMDFKPNIVFIKLGSNDSKPHNWKTAAEYGADATALVQKFQALASKPRIILCSPAPAFKGAKGEDVFGIRDSIITGEEIPALIEVAKKTNSEFVDLHQELLLYGASTAESWMMDKIHPDPFGAEAIAKRIAEQVQMKPDPTYDVLTKLKANGIAPKESKFLGTYNQYDFTLPGNDKVPCIVVAPHTPAAGHPWIWRARFFGHQPALDSALLDRGFHVGYCDIIELFGNDEAMKRWDAFYKLSQKLGLAPKMILEGMSRGGLPIFNWGKKNSDKVHAIYGDNPVCDIRSWPGKKDAKLYADALKCHGITEAQAADFKGNPFDGLETLAKAKVPVLLVLGADDEVVPLAENANILIERYRKLNGPVETWVKPGMKHHPHGLSPVFPLLRSILRASGRDVNPATTPVASVEYRSGAGWQGRNWQQEFDHVKKTLASKKDAKLVFLGDSITQGWSGSQDRVATEGGSRAIDRYAKWNAVSTGIAGNRTEHMLAMLENGLLDEVNPKAIVLMIGVNNANTGQNTGREVALGTTRVIEEVRKREPQAKLIVFGSFPGQDKNTLVRQSLDLDQDLLARWVQLKKDKSIIYVDPRPAFLNADGSLNDGIRSDKIHLTPKGYDIWSQLLEKPLADAGFN